MSTAFEGPIGLVEWEVNYYNELRERKASGDNISSLTLEQLKERIIDSFKTCEQYPKHHKSLKLLKEKLEGNDINTSQQHRIEETSNENKPVESPGKNLFNIVNLDTMRKPRKKNNHKEKGDTNTTKPAVLEVLDLNNINAIISEINSSNNKKADRVIKGIIKVVTIAALYTLELASEDQLFVLSDNEIEDRKIKDTVEIMCGMGKQWGQGGIDIDDVSATCIENVFSSLKSIIEKLFNNSDFIYKLDVISDSFKMAKEKFPPKKSDPNVLYFSNNIPLQIRGMEQKTLDVIADTFGSLLEGKQYQFNQAGAMVELIILSNNLGYWKYTIDPGCLLGRGISIIGNTPAGTTQYVNIKHTEIVKKILDDPLYILSPEEVQIARSDMFMNERIYCSIDMSDMNNYFDKLSEDEYNKLGKKLSYIINIDIILVSGNLPRMRFGKFNSIDDFELVSDKDCLSPIYNITSNILFPELKIVVKGDQITVYIGQNSTEYKIENYGLL